MKQFCVKRLATYASGAALLALTGCATKQPSHVVEASTAKVLQLNGGARYTIDGGTWRLLKTGESIPPGAVIQTADKSRLELALPRASSAYAPASPPDTVWMSPNSLLGLEKLAATGMNGTAAGDTQLDLKAGSISGVVHALNEGSRFEIKLPTGVAGTRGTVYDITAEGLVRVQSGSLVLAYTRPDHSTATQVVQASQEFDARTGALTSGSQ